MRGYAANEEATTDTFKGGWFHSGDLAVRHPDGYIEIKVSLCAELPHELRTTTTACDDQGVCCQ